MEPVEQNSPFYQALVEEPYNDEPRLIFADWMEEQGDSARAEFIRAQIWLEQTPFWDPSYESLKETAESLWADNKDRWTQHLDSFTPDFEFRRGFVDRVILKTSTKLSAIRSMVQRFPTVRALKVKGYMRFDNTLIKFSKDPIMSSFLRLNIASNMLDAKQVSSLIDGEHIQSLHAINLFGNGISPTILSKLLSADYFPNLNMLSICSTNLKESNQTWRAFASPKFEQMEWLDISTNWHLAPARAINKAFENQTRSSLQFLEMGYGNNPSSSTMSGFFKSPAFASLKQLNINMPLNDDNFSKLLKTPSQIETLQLSATTIKQVRMLLDDCAIWENLKVLSVPCRHTEFYSTIARPEFLGRLKAFNSHCLDKVQVQNLRDQFGLKVNDPNYVKIPGHF